MLRRSEPTLILFCGLPGSGKTTLARQFATAGRGIRVCTDDWQEDLGVDHNNEEFHERLQRRLYVHSLQLLKSGLSVVLEDGLWMKPERDEKLADARKCGARTELHLFDLTFETIWNRLEARNRELPSGAVSIPKQELERYWAVFERPDSDELAQFDEVIVHKSA